jgi:multidrug resistance protein MdtO
MNPPPPSHVPWFKALLRDLTPTPGRLSGTLRIVLASAIALVLLETLQMPFVSIGMYFIFLIGRDSPAVSLRSSAVALGIVCFAIVVELGVVIVTDNDPIARLVSVAVVTFVSGMMVVCTSQPALGSTLGLIYCTVIGLWETHTPANNLVKTSLYLVGTFLIVLGSGLAVEYIFGDRDPAAKLQEQRRVRYAALTDFFGLYADDASQELRFEAATNISRIAIAGQDGMMTLYNAIVERDLDTHDLPIALRPRITMLAQLMDVAAAFGLQNPPTIDSTTRARCARIAEVCTKLTPGSPISESEPFQVDPAGRYTLLDRVEGALHAILTMPSNAGVGKNRELVALPRKEVPFLIPGALRSRENVAFGLKICLCATLCYILYHALAWPGLSTSVTTVLVTGLSTTGAIKQRLVFRILGSAIGGLILGIGATVFLFPHMDSITSLIVLEAVIAFMAAWIAAGPKFNYIGLQIAFSFYIVAYEGLSAPTELAPARDRLIGIVLALLLMIMVFDRLWPVRTTTLMRRGLSSVLRVGADFLTLLNLATGNEAERKKIQVQVDVMRDRVGATVAGLRSANGSVPYEFGLNREQQIQIGDSILRAALAAAALFWNQLAVLHNAEDRSYLVDPGLQEMRLKLSAHLRLMAEEVLQISPLRFSSQQLFLDAAIIAHPHYAEYVKNTIDRIEELERFAVALGQAPLIES